MSNIYLKPFQVLPKVMADISSLMLKGLRNVAKANGGEFWWVIGNEACDLDSAVSALCYSVLLGQENKCSAFILNVDRLDYPLKTEVVYWFETFGIKERDLIFRDEVDLSSNKVCLKDADKSDIKVFLENNSINMQKLHPNICLVDHHSLASKDESLNHLVKEIIDHHPLNQVPSCAKLTHAIVGSCCTLNVELTRTRCPELLKLIGTLLHGVIVLDTVNGSPAAGRMTDRDESALTYLEQTVPNLDRAEVFGKLLAAKSNISHLSSCQILRRDCKYVGDVPISSLPMLVNDFMKLSDAPDAIEANREKYRALLMLGINIQDDSVRRELAVSSTSVELLGNLCNALCKADLGLEITTDEKFLKIYRQNNSKASRKQVLPLVQQFFM